MASEFQNSQKHLNQRCEQEVMRFSVGRCLGTAPSTRNVVVRDNTIQIVTLGSPESLKGRNSLNTCPNGWCLYSDTMVTRLGQGVTGGGEETPLSAVRPCGMGVPQSEALDMSGSPHLTIGYLLRIGCGDLESQVDWLR